MRHSHCLQSDKALASVGSASKRKSIKQSDFATTHAELLRPIYKYYQAMQFATHGHCFPCEAINRKANVQMLLDAAREYLARDKASREPESSSQARVCLHIDLIRVGESSVQNLNIVRRLFEL